MKPKCCGEVATLYHITASEHYGDYYCKKCENWCEVVTETQDEGWKQRFENHRIDGGSTLKELFSGGDMNGYQSAVELLHPFIAQEISKAESQAVTRYVQGLQERLPEEISADVPTSLDIPEDVLADMHRDMKNFREGWNKCRSQVLALLSVDEVNGKKI